MIGVLYPTIRDVGEFVAVSRAHGRPRFSGQGILVSAIDERPTFDIDVFSQRGPVFLRLIQHPPVPPIKTNS
jgi:hypothetical protein